MKVQMIQMPYRGERGGPEISTAPASIDDDGLHGRLAGDGAEVAPSVTVALTDEEETQYGAWRRVALANRHLADCVADARVGGVLPIGLLANCNGLPGMLAGLQGSAGGELPRTVGLIWVDAHADFNTPETTLSGLLGGMPVAVSAGMCLHRMRETAGLAMPILTDRIVMCGLRDVDPLEQTLLNDNGVAAIAIDDLAGSDALDELFAGADAVYVHIDMDVLDPAEVAGHSLTVPGGPTSAALADLLRGLFGESKIEALGIASTPAPEQDEQGSAKSAAQRLICAAVSGALRHRSRDA